MKNLNLAFKFFNIVKIYNKLSKNYEKITKKLVLGG